MKTIMMGIEKIIIKGQQEQDKQAEQQEQKGGDSYEDALNDDELKQKALAQANDAKLEGNKLFGNGQYEEALLQYEIALQVAPEMSNSVEIRSYAIQIVPHAF
ncbi:hypothetical protein SLA2020_231550 [Shorea laevis]